VNPMLGKRGDCFEKNNPTGLAFKPNTLTTTVALDS